MSYLLPRMEPLHTCIILSEHCMTGKAITPGYLITPPCRFTAWRCLKMLEFCRWTQFNGVQIIAYHRCYLSLNKSYSIVKIISRITSDVQRFSFKRAELNIRAQTLFNTSVTVSVQLILRWYLSIFIGPESDHCLPLSLTHSLPNWLTDWLLFSNLIDVTLACEDANSKLV